MRRHLFLIFILISTFAIVGCKITGKITENGKGVEGITVTLSGDASMSTTTDAGGTYVFNGIRPGDYEVKPADDKHAFKPPSKKVKIDHKNKIAHADFEVDTSPPPPQASLPPWSTYQGNAAHTGYVPVILNPENFFEGWTQNIIESGALNPVAAGGGKVFVTTAGSYGPNVAVALDSATGAELWNYDFDVSDPTDPIYYIGPPAYANGTVYIQSGVGVDSYLWAFDAELGGKLFNTGYDNQSFRYYAPTIYDDGNVYIAGGYGGAYGFDGGTGDELWDVEWNSPYEQWTPAVNDTHVIAYSGFYNPQLTVIDRSTGEVDFTIPDLNFDSTGISGFSMDLAPVLGSQNNVIAIQDGRLISFDLTNRIIGWETRGGEEEDVENEGFSGQPSLASGVIFAVFNGDLRAINASDGSFVEDWQPWQPPQNEMIVTPMIVTDNLIFVSTENTNSPGSTTYAVDLETQKRAWSYSTGGQLALSDEGVLFIATADGQLIAIFTD
jgi:outer membrane protein assembly factor BamB